MRATNAPTAAIQDLLLKALQIPEPTRKIPHMIKIQLNIIPSLCQPFGYPVPFLTGPWAKRSCQYIFFHEVENFIASMNGIDIIRLPYPLIITP